MLLLIERVEFSIVGFLVQEHAEEDFKQPLTQAPESTGVTHSLLALGLIISLAPSTGFAKTIRPEVHGVTHKLIARPAHLSLMNLAGLIAYRGGAGKGLQHLMFAVASGVGADGGQQPWR